MKLKPPEVPTPEMAWRQKGKGMPCRHPVEFVVDRFHDRSNAGFFCLTLIPGLERNENEGTISSIGLREEAASHNRTVVLNAFRLFEHGFNLPGERVRPLQRCCVRQLDIQVEITLIFVGQESGR